MVRAGKHGNCIAGRGRRSAFYLGSALRYVFFRVIHFMSTLISYQKAYFTKGTSFPGNRKVPGNRPHRPAIERVPNADGDEGYRLSVDAEPTSSVEQRNESKLFGNRPVAADLPCRDSLLGWLPLRWREPKLLPLKRIESSVVGALATRAVSSFFTAIPGVSLAVRFLLPALINTGGIGNMMMPPGEGTSGTEPPLPDPSGSEGSTSWTGKTSFEEQVLLEPFPEPETEATSANPATPFHRNVSLEMSLRNRISLLEEEHTLFLLDKERGEYWADIKTSLDQAPSQSEYNRILDFESRDLQIREKKHSVFALYQHMRMEHPDLVERAAYNYKEALMDFFEEKRNELDTHLVEWSSVERDRREIQFLNEVENDLRSRGPHSIYMNRILGIE
ncbi:hypothetical protein FEM48_ZijujMtG0001300 (mitochondrion) [Ziziphus jujuba var. spinosa]|uniref:Uncharacterized protein n=1 Tax=Ziziphus jujuba var. spinosa TaxID=714518 RepID=A0A978UA64_ZIZJJ|nr:hypothetical protein FEM48_ZijujMtG0001300 [Ziziphus jujuba var. spinosa]